MYCAARKRHASTTAAMESSRLASSCRARWRFTSMVFTSAMVGSPTCRRQTKSPPSRCTQDPPRFRSGYRVVRSVRKSAAARSSCGHAMALRADAIVRALLATVTLVVSASAQPDRSKPSAVIIGVVADSNLFPIPNADVNIGGSSVRVTADSLGRFRITNVPAGRFVLIARRIGFQPGISPIDVTANDTLWLSFTLDPAAHELPTMVVTERTLSAKLMEFNQRRKLGFGQFFTRDDIDKINPLQVVDIVRRATAVRIGPSGQNAGSARYKCPMSIYLDGIPLGNIRLDYLPPPNDIAAVEVYAGASTVPVWLPRGPFGMDQSC